MTELFDFTQPNGGAGIAPHQVTLHLGNERLREDDQVRQAHVKERLNFNWWRRFIRGLYYGRQERKRLARISRATRANSRR